MGFALAVLVALATSAARRSAVDPAEVLRRAEEIRSPDVDYAVDFSISVLDEYTPGKERVASYTMLAHGKQHAIVLMLTPESFYGGTLLIGGREYWLLLPKASQAIQLSSEAILRGDVSNGDLARADLVAQYSARFDGEREVDGAACLQLELAARSADAPYPRIRAVVEKSKHLPRTYEYYGRTGALLRTARYSDFQRTPLGLRSMKLTIEGPLEMQRSTTMVFSNLRRLDPSAVAFSPAGMIAFRDAALARRAEAGRPAPIERLLEELLSSKTAR